MSDTYLVARPMQSAPETLKCPLRRSVSQIPYAFDKLLATAQFMTDRVKKGRSLWYVFWHGDAIEDGKTALDDFERPALAVLRDMIQGGVNVPWNLAASIALGGVLMFSRVLFDASGQAANNDHLVGALVITVAAIALAEMARPLRYVNVLFGAWLLAAPWVLEGYSALGTWASLIVGVLLIALSLRRGLIRAHYSAWDRVIR